MDIKRIPVSGDPFYVVAHDQDDRLCARIDGVVYLGRTTFTEDGEEVEVVEAVPCRRCRPQRGRWSLG